MYLNIYVSGLYTYLPLVYQLASEPTTVYAVVGLAVGWLMRKLGDMRGGGDA